ncbi:unnamed protein product [Caretta caretta]
MKPVPIFIHMDATEYSLPCSQREMHVTNPTYRWAQDRRESQLLSVSAQGALTFRHFQGGSSGNYSCTISYKEHRHPRAQTFHYKVMGETCFWKGGAGWGMGGLSPMEGRDSVGHGETEPLGGEGKWAMGGLSPIEGRGSGQWGD